MKNLLDERRFLNKGGHHSTAAICSVVNFDEEDIFYSPIEVQFSISDCSRVITLSIDVSTVDELENSLFKLQQLIDVSESTKKCLEENRGIIENFEERKKLEKQKNGRSTV